MSDPYAELQRAEGKYRNATFSDTDCIKGLIKLRSSLDILRESRNDSPWDAASASAFNTELVCLYADLDKLIARSRLSNKQQFILERLMDGWHEDEIATLFRQRVNRIYAMLDTACDKIKRENDLMWKHEFVFIHYVRMNSGTKRCSGCGNEWPRHEDFYRKRSDGKGDGYYGKCRRCGR
ncbi:hypothetical protein [Paenibacillus cymbidii]|uniref:hypothetical protein n=1 Tax=Paenibacillus cymbidii TaxID=1639034 RepID=UPI0010803F98|nr:hypothetical protein [Paenibacillus cymbidii]